MQLVKTTEELIEAKAKKVAEFAALPDKSIFGDDNRAAEKLMIKTFDRLGHMVVGYNLDGLLDDLYDLHDTAEAMEYVADESIGIVEWAGGIAELDG